MKQLELDLYPERQEVDADYENEIYLENLIERFIEEGLSEQEAEKKAKDFMESGLVPDARDENLGDEDIDKDNLCGKSHNNGEPSCLECEVIKSGE
jgi:hypothetical protein